MGVVHAESPGISVSSIQPDADVTTTLRNPCTRIHYEGSRPPRGVPNTDRYTHVDPGQYLPIHRLNDSTQRNAIPSSVRICSLRIFGYLQYTIPSDLASNRGFFPERSAMHIAYERDVQVGSSTNRICRIG